MTRHYYVATAAEATSPLPQANQPDGLVGGAYLEGSTAVLPSTAPGAGQRVNGVTHIPSLGLYQATEDNAVRPTPAEYYQYGTNLYFEDNANAAAIRVREEQTNTQIPIEELYRLKQIELANYVQQVTYSAIDVGDPNWAWVLDGPRRLQVTDINEFLQDRMKDVVFDGDTKTYWPPGYSTHIIRQHKTFSSQKQYEIDSDLGAAGWGALMKAKGVHSEAMQTASWLCGQDIDAAFDANGGGGWAALAAIDVESYAWPPFWVVSPI